MRRWSIGLALVLAVASDPCLAAVTERISVSSTGEEGNGDSTRAATNGDGRLVVFESLASNLIVADSNDVCDTDGDFVFIDNCSDVFVRDRVLGTTVRVSVATDAGEALGASSRPDITPDGRFVVFQSTAPDLVDEDGNGASDVFVHDRVLATTERVSVGSGGFEGDGASMNAHLSADGRFVVFESDAENLTVDGNHQTDVFLRDRQDGVTLLLSIASASFMTGDDASDTPSISDDARRVLFRTFATDVAADEAAGDTDPDLVLYDRERDSLGRVSVPGGEGPSIFGILAPDGESVVVQQSLAGVSNLFRFDLRTARTELVSENAAGVPGDNESFGAALADDGRYVAFTSFAGNLVYGDTNECGGHSCDDVFVRDRLAGTTTRVSISTAGDEADGPSDAQDISGDGRVVVFLSAATNLVPGDLNDHLDVFVRASVCGDGTRDAGEECDDGNTASGDGCSATCQLDCPTTPLAGCRRPITSGKASLLLRDETADDRDQMTWRWLAGATTPAEAFGDPTVRDGYRLCIYDVTGPVLGATAPAGTGWTPRAGRFVYRSKTLLPGGIAKLSLKAGLVPGQSRIVLRGKDAPLAMPPLAALVAPLTVQLANPAGECWAAVYDAPLATQTDSLLRARGE